MAGRSKCLVAPPAAGLDSTLCNVSVPSVPNYSCQRRSLRVPARLTAIHILQMLQTMMKGTPKKIQRTEYQKTILIKDAAISVPLLIRVSQNTSQQTG